MFTVDHKTEHYLRSVMGVNVEYREDVKYDELASGWFVKNLGRPQGQSIVTPAVETYQHMMEDGSAAPAPILRDAPSGFGVLDGIQRLTANERTGATKFAAYIIKCGDNTARKIRYAANLRLNTAAPVDEQTILKQLIDDFMINGSDSARDISEVTGRQVAIINKVYKRRLAASWISSACQNEQGSDGPDLKDGILDVVASAAKAEDFSGDHAKTVVKFVNTLHACGFKNGDAVGHTEAFFTVKRIGSKNRTTQFRTKFRQFTDDPIVQGKLSGKTKLTAVETIDGAIKTLLTRVKNYKKGRAGDLDNRDLLKSWDTKLDEVNRVLRECCSTELRHQMNPFASKMKVR